MRPAGAIGNAVMSPPAGAALDGLPPRHQFHVMLEAKQHRSFRRER
jgi:hypothetical protein